MAAVLDVAGATRQAQVMPDVEPVTGRSWPAALRRSAIPAMLPILAVGGFLRLWALGAVGFNSDEAVYAGQAASIAGNPALSSLFPVFRAHPLLFPSVLSRQAERIIALRPGDRTRSRAFGQLILVTVLVSQGKPDEACAVAQQVLDATQSLGSYLVIQQLLDLKQLLEPHRANKVVADFLVCLGEALRERTWLYQWLTKDRHSNPIGLGEGA